MTAETAKKMIDACYLAKRVRDMLPELPDGVTPGYIHILDVIEKRKREFGSVCISEISDALHLPRPGITKSISEMERKGYLRKVPSSEDGRIIHVEITDAGDALSEKYNRRFFDELVCDLNCISERNAEIMIGTIDKLYYMMCERKNRFE